MTLIQISEKIKREFLDPLENFDINSEEDLDKLHKKLIEIRGELYFRGLDVMPHYRGEQYFGWDILPGIVRPPFYDDVEIQNIKIVEKKGAEIFEKTVTEEYGQEMLFKPKNDNTNIAKWDLLFQAQHAGVKTSLVDFSTDVFLSSFFMSEPSESFENENGQLWCLLVPSDFIYNESSDYHKNIYPSLDPYNLTQSFICNVPTFIDEINDRTYQFRLFKQHGRFFASSNSDIETPINKKEFWKNLMIRIKISPEAKKNIFEGLNKMKITRKDLMLEESEKADELISDINIQMKKL